MSVIDFLDRFSSGKINIPERKYNEAIRSNDIKLSKDIADGKHWVLEHKRITSDHINQALKHNSKQVRLAAFDIANFGVENIESALSSPYTDVRSLAAKHNKATEQQINKSLDDSALTVAINAASNKNATSNNIHKALSHQNAQVRFEAITNLNATDDHFQIGLNDVDPLIRHFSEIHLGI